MREAVRRCVSVKRPACSFNHWALFCGNKGCFQNLALEGTHRSQPVALGDGNGKRPLCIFACLFPSDDRIHSISCVSSSARSEWNCSGTASLSRTEVEFRKPKSLTTFKVKTYPPCYRLP